MAAYKSAIIASRLVQAGHNVCTVMTASAERFIGRATFVALTGRQVVRDVFDPAFPLGAHIELAREYDALCIAPATANQIGKIANGIADDLLSTVCLCFKKPIVIAPAMNYEMWEAPSLQRNVTQLVDDGFTLVGPEEGWLSCRVKGLGRMSEPEAIIDALYDVLKNQGSA